ncbi:MAG TPA: septum formation initiator family protein [Candidatus Acidoferrum sp.]|nr:septum formation initiator family protein [Candidatus Acidoferrum sp.]
MIVFTARVNIWEKLSKVVVFLLFVAGIAAVSVWYLPLIRQNERMRQDLLKIEAKVKTEEEKGRMLRASLDAVKNDPRTIERLARANLGFAKPGEVVVRFEEPRR